MARLPPHDWPWRLRSVRRERATIGAYRAPTWRFRMLHAAVGALRRLMSQSRVAIGDITFGMEDGAVSVSGLVFGVAAGTSDSSLVVLAGATGAIAGAVSMMAGRYLDVQSVGHRGEALLNTTRQHIAHAPGPYLDRAAHRLRAAGLTLEEATTVVEVFERNPDALLD